jgi:hypothetical protein
MLFRFLRSVSESIGRLKVTQSRSGKNLIILSRIKLLSFEFFPEILN